MTSTCRPKLKYRKVRLRNFMKWAHIPNDIWNILEQSSKIYKHPQKTYLKKSFQKLSKQINWNNFIMCIISLHGIGWIGSNICWTLTKPVSLSSIPISSANLQPVKALWLLTSTNGLLQRIRSLLKTYFYDDLDDKLVSLLVPNVGTYPKVTASPICKRSCWVNVWIKKWRATRLIKYYDW